MKEKLLLFIPMGSFRNQKMLEDGIASFRKAYPTLRTVEEVEQIDYTKQCVKIILVNEISPYASKYLGYQFTNTSGRVYKTFCYEKLVS